ncbi:MAG: NTP pyrophosphohydrolase including oxidative damage repair enzyme [Candidatus Curtissbacteria bacterium GW2011_GWA1_40_16]|uniref:NTP pyrophosphohydrolase including oxidative damage repair enzyme n=1 Tax=Candidatus Curtissbacteria bacterium GW2011_GWA1_40_16 TaxID=1618405 RepID=A0A0G0TRU6_9BACT|nr:MAG: NTP pyrophosphohydrolase including oxidative damage repair enzyme [Candidatus Curtissbacteria bacterium GW2011_GWA1_40_16]
MNIKKGPWTITDSKTVYQNPWIKVREDKVIRPDGKNGIYGIVEMKHGISVLPIDNDGNVYLTREYHYAVEQITTEVVSGGIDKGENKEDATKRELREELGITASELIYLGKVLPLTSLVEITNHLFLARGLRFSEARPEGTEIIKVVKVSMKKAVDLVFDGTICDGTTVALILKAKEYLGL